MITKKNTNIPTNMKLNIKKKCKIKNLSAL